ncbi:MULTISPECIES: hypothetical protein [Halocynthiibacter]|uniref:Uncharacterized protein n=1 Tax=Halocynthiibacter halioticoli TaxID=2986804 RepID=A0AAE3IZE0_9RHOB|nr:MULTISPECIES: hypothetical protein [Halocynthiibacter]MCV6823291.1 hypothetical protein [Halocynthiibacter halioticoli]MCW4056292.1 hypothetical protein [Halocynthiibacter sp. SDUM655004]MDE0590742.1 hypothetical protein [Halocynthiibacter sp. C4]
MRILAFLAVTATLSACGVDGRPTPPPSVNDNPPPGISISGEARIGVVMR